jgi:hypothetical protein
MPGRNDKLPIVPHQGEAVEIGTLMGPLTLAKVEEEMATAIIAVCTMTRRENLYDVLLPEHVRTSLLLEVTGFFVIVIERNLSTCHIIARLEKACFENG